MTDIKKIETTLKVSDSAFSISRNVKSMTSDDFQTLMLLIKGKEVKASIYSETNFVGHTNEKQLKDAYDSLSIEEKRFYINENKFNNIVEKFGDGKLGFSMSGMYCSTPLEEIHQLLEENGMKINAPRKNKIKLK